MGNTEAGLLKHSAESPPHLAHVHDECLGVLADRGQIQVPARGLKKGQRQG